MHNGEIVELVIRKEGANISKLSKRLHVSRQTMYNWFTIKDLDYSVIYKIGTAINHDFSIEFPQLFTQQEMHFADMDGIVYNPPNTDYWKNKYISLLEKYSEEIKHNSH